MSVFLCKVLIMRYGSFSFELRVLDIDFLLHLFDWQGCLL